MPSECSIGLHFLPIAAGTFSLLGMSFELVDTSKDGEQGQSVLFRIDFEEHLVVLNQGYLTVVLDFSS